MRPRRLNRGPLHFMSGQPQLIGSMSVPTSESALATPATGFRVAGGIVAYRLYDVGYALDLEQAARLLEGQATGRTRPTRTEAKALVIAQPPLILALGPVALSGSGSRPSAELSACCFDFGVVSLRLRVAVPDGTAWPELLALVRGLERTDLA